MSEVAGLGDCELEGIVQKLQNGGATRVLDNKGREVFVRVEFIDPVRQFDPYM